MRRHTEILSWGGAVDNGDGVVPFGIISNCDSRFGCSDSIESRLKELMAEHLTLQHELGAILMRTNRVAHLGALVCDSARTDASPNPTNKPPFCFSFDSFAYRLRQQLCLNLGLYTPNISLACVPCKRFR